MQSLLPAMLSLTLIFLTSCSSTNPLWVGNWGFGDSVGESLYGQNDIPDAPDADLPAPVLSVHAEEVTNIVQEYSVELKHLKRVHLQHAHTYYNEGGIHTIQLEYISQDIVELCQARNLIIDISEGFLEKLNSNPILVPEFTNQAFYPFNLEIYICFESYFVKYVDPFYIKWITMEDGVISFYAANADDLEKKGWQAKKESYDTSRNIVFYERMAEDNFKAMHETNRAIFGSKRFWPTYNRPAKVLE
jgi:hypothetical protein